MNNPLPLTPDLFVLGGNALFTIQSEKTGTRFTYRSKADKSDSKRVYVSVLTGSENESDYSYLGTIFRHSEEHAVFHHGKKSRISPESKSAIAFKWFWEHSKDLPKTVKFVKSSKCCRCGRTLTTPESVEAGYGPECSKALFG
jgi:hypothetical protein